MKCKYCDKILNETESTKGMCFTCYGKLELVRRLVAKCNEIKRKCKNGKNDTKL